MAFRIQKKLSHTQQARDKVFDFIERIVNQTYMDEIPEDQFKVLSLAIFGSQTNGKQIG